MNKQYDEYKFGGKVIYWCLRDSFWNVHAVDKPALIYPTGEKRWYRHGVLHRKDGPAIEKFKGIIGIDLYYLNGWVIINRQLFIEKIKNDVIKLGNKFYLKDGRIIKL